MRLGLDTQEGRDNWDDRIALLVGAAAIVIIVGAILGAGVMFVRLYLDGTVQPNGNPLRVIFASRLMLGGARLAILFVGVYIMVSILVHMRRGQWLTGAGPLKVSEAARRLTSNVSEQDERFTAAQGEVERLRATISDLTTQLRVAEGLLDRAQKQLRDRS